MRPSRPAASVPGRYSVLRTSSGRHPFGGAFRKRLTRVRHHKLALENRVAEAFMLFIVDNRKLIGITCSLQSVIARLGTQGNPTRPSHGHKDRRTARRSVAKATSAKSTVFKRFGICAFGPDGMELSWPRLSGLERFAELGTRTLLASPLRGRRGAYSRNPALAKARRHLVASSSPKMISASAGAVSQSSRSSSLSSCCAAQPE